MKPLNSQERAKQFFVFLAFFVVTTALAIGIVFFNAIYNPKYNNEALKKDKFKLESQNDFYESHAEKVKSFINKINKIRALSLDPNEMKSRITNEYSEIEKDLRFDGVPQTMQTDLIVNIDSLQYYTLKSIDEIQMLKESLTKGKDSYDELYNAYKTHLESEGTFSPPVKKQF